MLITLVRHGETDWNAQRRLQGATDVPLNDTGREQARDAGRRLADRADGAYLAASDLSRARETAEIIGAELGLGEPATYSALRERSYGEAEGVGLDEFRRRFAGTDIPGAETDEHLEQRLRAGLDAVAEAARAAGATHVIAVSHGGVIGRLLRAATADAVPAPGQRVVNGSAHTFSWNDGALTLVDHALVDV